jgi:hypothetical protein
MLPRVNIALALAAGFLLLARFPLPAAAAAAAEAVPEAVAAAEEGPAGQAKGAVKGYEWLSRELRVRDWEPSLAVTSGITFQALQAQASSTIDQTGRLGVNPGDPLAKPGRGEDEAVSPYVGINAEVMTPELPGGIRFFVNGEYLPTFAAELDVEKVGDPSGLTVPAEFYSLESTCGEGPLQPGCNCPYGFGCYTEEAITGAGSKVSATVGRDVFGAAIGVALPFEAFGRKLMLKPSFGWIRYTVDVSANQLRAIKVPLDASPVTPTLRPLPVVRFVELNGSAAPAFNAIGPGLELEMEVHQSGPIGASLFLDAHGYRVLGSRKVKLSDTQSRSCATDPVPIVAPPGQPVTESTQRFLCNLAAPRFNQFGPEDGVYSADWAFKVDPWLYRVGLGLRFRWIGEQ